MEGEAGRASYPNLTAATELARRLGVTGSVTDDDDLRLEVYVAATYWPEHHELLLEAIRQDPDAGVSASPAHHMLELVPADQAERWIEALPADARAEARARAADIEELRAVLAGARVVQPSDVERWSDWLQRQVKDQATDDQVLEALAVAGRERNTRIRAKQRQTELRRAAARRARSDAHSEATSSGGPVPE